jgi:hypothetical protein
MGTAANVVFGGATVTIGSDLGYIKDGLRISKEEEIYYVTGIEGLPTPPAAHRTSMQYTFGGTLIEPTLDNIALVWAATDARGTTTVLEVGDKNEMDITNNLIKSVTFTGIEPGGSDARTIVAALCTADGPGEMVISDAEEAALPFTFKALYNTSNDYSFTITDV